MNCARTGNTQSSCDLINHPDQKGVKFCTYCYRSFRETYQCDHPEIGAFLLGILILLGVMICNSSSESSSSNHRITEQQEISHR